MNIAQTKTPALVNIFSSDRDSRVDTKTQAKAKKIEKTKNV